MGDLKNSSSPGSDRRQWQRIFGALVEMVRTQQSQVETLANDRKFLERYIQIQHDRWASKAGFLESHISQVRRIPFPNLGIWRAPSSSSWTVFGNPFRVSMKLAYFPSLIGRWRRRKRRAGGCRRRSWIWCSGWSRERLCATRNSLVRFPSSGNLYCSQVDFSDLLLPENFPASLIWVLGLVHLVSF